MKKIIIDNAMYQIPDRLYEEIWAVHEDLLYVCNEYQLYDLKLLLNNAKKNYPRIYERGIQTPEVDKPDGYDCYKKENELDEELYKPIKEGKLPF